MRRGELVWAQVNRLRVGWHTVVAVRTIVPHPGAAAQEPAARQAGLALLLSQSAPLRRDDGRRRSGDLELAEFLLSRRNRAGSSRSGLGDTLYSRHRTGGRVQGLVPREMGRSPARGEQVP